MRKNYLTCAALISSMSMSAIASAPVLASDNSDVQTFKIGICNYVDDASLNQIVSNIEKQLEKIEKDSDGSVVFEVTTENCMADATVLDQIIANFIADDVDLMVGVATPVAMAMQAATEDNEIPVVFAAVSDPVSTGLVDSMDEPGANITGTSDYLDTTAVMDLLFAADEDAEQIALLYDQGQDSLLPQSRKQRNISMKRVLSIPNIPEPLLMKLC